MLCYSQIVGNGDPKSIGVPPVNVDASPPRDPGWRKLLPEGSEECLTPGNQVRRGSEQPDRGCWMPWDSGAEEISELALLVTSVHRGRAHYPGIPGSPPIRHTISKCSGGTDCTDSL